EDATLFERACKVIARVHEGLPELSRLEEALTRAAFSKEAGGAEIDRALRRVLRTMAERPERAEELSAWFLRALPRLPERVRKSGVAWALAVGAGARLKVAPVLGVDAPEGSVSDFLPVLLPPGTRDVEIGVERRGDVLVAGVPVTEKTRVRLPDTNPLLLEVEEEGSEPKVVVLRRGERKLERVKGRAVTLRTLRGDEYKLQPAPRGWERRVRGSFRWLLFSDQRARAGEDIDASFQRAFGADLDSLAQRSGPVDIMLIAGDLSANGSVYEVDWALRGALRLMDRQRRSPYLIAVPGNHDWSRSVLNEEVIEQYARMPNAELLSEDFWERADHPLRSLIERAFERFREEPIMPKAGPATRIVRGIFPGDFAVTLELGFVRVGVVGLNSAFLTPFTYAFKSRPMVLDPRQLLVVCQGDPDAWAREHDVTLLLTHHGAESLDEQSARRFLTEIAPPWRFDLHLIGQRLGRSENQWSLTDRWEWRAASLGGPASREGSTRRDLGYALGRFEVDHDKRSLHVWPRSWDKHTQRFTPDLTIFLGPDEALSRELPSRAPGQRAPRAPDVGYVERSSAREILKRLGQGRSALVRGPRGSGKSTLLRVAQERLRALGVHVVLVSLTSSSDPPATLLSALSGVVDEALGIDDATPVRLARLRRGQSGALPEEVFTFLDRHLTRRMALLIDNVELLDEETWGRLGRDYQMLQARGLVDREGAKLTVCLAGATRRATLSSILDVTLEDFDRSEMKGFAPALPGLLWPEDEILTAIFDWTSGEPQTTRAAVDMLRSLGEAYEGGRETAHAVVGGLFEVAYPTASQWSNPLEIEEISREALLLYLEVLDLHRESKVWQYEAAQDKPLEELKALGLVRRRFQPRNKVYARIYDHAWIQRKLDAQLDAQLDAILDARPAESNAPDLLNEIADASRPDDAAPRKGAKGRYRREMFERFGFTATWPPNDLRAVGDVGILSDGAFVRMTTLRKLGIAFDVRVTEAPAGLAHASSEDVSISVVSPKIGPAAAVVELGSSGAFLFQSKGAERVAIDDPAKLSRDVMARLKAGAVWDPEWVVVTDVVTAKSATLLLSNESSSRLEIGVRPGIWPDPAALADVDAGLHVVSQRGEATVMLAEQSLAPLYRTFRIKRALVGLVHQALIKNVGVETPRSFVAQRFSSLPETEGIESDADALEEVKPE
ncbi:MAG TPA: AAA family ATPase, partial [Polyangiaceae bacterium]|nr:AAA family ATPase [Polyangiaceae bacterium]